MRHAVAALFAAFVIAAGAVGAQEGPYRFARAIPIGGEGGWDYLTVDAQAHRLYVSHATKIVVIDTESYKAVGEIADTPGVHGIALAPELGRGFSSNGRENKVSIVDLKTLKTIQKVTTGDNPDAILYEPGRKEVYAFNGRGKSATVIDAAKGTVIATIPLEGKPEFAQADSKAGRIFVNLEDLNSIKVIDTAKHAVASTWPIAPGESASGMAIDLDNHRLYIGCDNKLMLMIDNTNGAVVYSVPIGEGVDANAFDPATKLAFASSGGSATVTVAREESPTLLKVVQTLKTVKGARTMALDPLTHRIYLAANVSGTFTVQVYEMVKGS